MQIELIISIATFIGGVIAVLIKINSIKKEMITEAISKYEKEVAAHQRLDDKIDLTDIKLEKYASENNLKFQKIEQEIYYLTKQSQEFKEFISEQMDKIDKQLEKIWKALNDNSK